MLTFNLCFYDGCWIAYPEDDCDSAEEVVRMLEGKRKLVVNKAYEKVFRAAIRKCKSNLRLEVVDDED